LVVSDDVLTVGSLFFVFVPPPKNTPLTEPKSVPPINPIIKVNISVLLPHIYKIYESIINEPMVNRYDRFALVRTSVVSFGVMFSAMIM
jgi:hypothetical protein